MNQNFDNKIESIEKEISFEKITDQNIQEVIGLESEIYPKEILVETNMIEEIIRRQDTTNLPDDLRGFLVKADSKNIGYFLMLPEKSRFGKDDVVLHIHDIAILPEYHGKKIGLKMMLDIFQVTKRYNVPAIELTARENTSYGLFTSPLIEKDGFKILEDKSDFQIIGGENFHSLRLENLDFDPSKQNGIASFVFK